jgi:IS30 family transposase
MDWSLLIKELMDAGVTQTEIGLAAGLAQSTISDLHRGRLKSTEYSAGEKIVALHKIHCSKKKAA